VDVFLKKSGKAVRVAELCHRAMPYPLVVVLHGGEAIMLSMAEKRCSRDGKEQVVLERVVNTDWMREPQLLDFCKAANFSNSRKLRFQELYLHYMNLLEVQRCALITGVFREDGLSPDKRRELLARLHQLEHQMMEIKAKAKRETELSRQIEFNIVFKRLEENAKAVLATLSAVDERI
jgi:hypothetical protein